MQSLLVGGMDIMIAQGRLTAQIGLHERGHRAAVAVWYPKHLHARAKVGLCLPAALPLMHVIPRVQAAP
jgi:hypothetical protein